MSLFCTKNGLGISPRLPRTLERAADQLAEEMLTAELAPPRVLATYSRLNTAADILRHKFYSDRHGSRDEQRATVRLAIDYMRNLEAANQRRED